MTLAWTLGAYRLTSRYFEYIATAEASPLWNINPKEPVMTELIKGASARQILASVDVHDAAQRILSVLGDIADLSTLPADGWIAGQAVSTAFEQIYLKAASPCYNDVDFFVHNLASFESNTVMALGAGNRVVYEYGEMNLALRIRYWVGRSRREGKLNWIDIKITDHQLGVIDSLAEHLDAGRSVIDAFDLNSVQIGIDLRQRVLFWTDAFADFIATRQLEVLSMHTPAHTAVRLLSKLEQHEQVWCDLPRVMTSLAGALKLAEYAETDRSRVFYCRKVLGPVIADKARRFERELAPYFELIEIGGAAGVTSQDEVRRHTLSPTVGLPRDLMMVGAHWHQTFYPELARLLLSPSKPLRRKKIEALLVRDDAEHHKAVSVVKLVCGLAGAVNDATDPGEIRKVVSFIKRNPRTSGWLFAAATSWKELVEVVGWFKEAIKREGFWILGLIEITPAPGSLEGDFNARLHAIREVIESRKVELSTAKGREKRFKARVYDKVQVRELSTPLELLKEGAQMRHCIGGYAAALQGSNLFFLSLRGSVSDPATWSTASICFDRPFSVTVYEHRSRFNGVPSAQNQAALVKVCDSILRSQMLRLCGVPSLTLARACDKLYLLWRKHKNEARFTEWSDEIPW